MTRYLCFQPYLLQFLALDEAFHSLLHQKQTDSMCSRFCCRVGNCHSNDNITHVTIGDENFAAIQDVVISIFFGIGSNSLKVTRKINVPKYKI